MPSTLAKCFIASLAFGAATALPQFDKRADPIDNDALLADLITTPSQIKRFQKLLTDGGQSLLTGDGLTKQTVFDFNEVTFPTPGGGQGAGATSVSVNLEPLTDSKLTEIQASTGSFPILLGSELTVTYATLGPCGVVMPHVHPRASEFFVVVDGEIDFGFLLEVGLLKDGSSPEIDGKLTQYKGTLFPQGSIHYQINDSPDCKPAGFFTTFPSEDIGATLILQYPAAVNSTTSVPAQVDGTGFDSIRNQVPPNIVNVVDKCLSRCNISGA